MEVKGWINVALCLAIVATLVQIAGYVAPLWVWLDGDGFQVGVGLWYTVGCGMDGSCKATTPGLVFGYGKKDTYDRPAFSAVRALETVGLALGVLLVLFLLVYRAGYGAWTAMGQLNMAAFVTCILTWLCILAGLIVYCACFWPVVGTSPLFTPRSWPWALLVCFFAALLYIVVSVLIRLKGRDRSYVQHAIPTSGDSKMDLNPVTKHGVMHRYFTPLNYNETRRANFAIAGHDESTLVPSLDRRLIGPEDMHTLEGHGLENGVHYRSHTTSDGPGPHAYAHTHSDTPQVRRGIANGVQVYPEPPGPHHLHHPRQAGISTPTATTTTALHVQTEGLSGPHSRHPLQAGGDYLHRGVREAAPLTHSHHHLQPHRHPYGGGPSTSSSSSPRDGGSLGRDTDGLLRVRGDGGGGRGGEGGGRAAYSVGTRHGAEGGRAGHHDHHHHPPTGGPGYTRDGRTVAGGDGGRTIASTELYGVSGADRQPATSDLDGDVHRGVLLEHTNHSLALGPTPGPRVITSLGADEPKPYDPTFIYRPYSEQS